MLEFQSPRFLGDPLLSEILNDPDTGQKKLGPNSPSGSVRRLQQAVFDLGWTLRIVPPFPDESQFVIGVYGPVTTRTVLAYKTHYDIHFPTAPPGVFDGFAGPRTFQQLDAHCVPFDSSVAAIEQKAAELQDEGIVVELDLVPPTTLPILGTHTAARHAFLDGAAGAIYHSASTGAHEVHGALFDEYLAQGSAAGPLGSPVSDVHEDSGFLRSDFEHGSLRLDPSTGAVEVLGL